MKNRKPDSHIMVFTGDLGTRTLIDGAYDLAQRLGYSRSQTHLLNYDYTPTLHERIPKKYRLPYGNPDDWFIKQFVDKGYIVQVEPSFA